MTPTEPVVAISGQELVPVLVDGDRIISDSPAILDYLEDRFPEPPLYPADERGAQSVDLRRLVRPCLEAAANLIAAEEEKPEPDRGGSPSSRSGSRMRWRSSSRSSPGATSSSATS